MISLQVLPVAQAIESYQLVTSCGTLACSINGSINTEAAGSWHPHSRLEMLLQVLIIPHVNIVLLIIGWHLSKRRMWGEMKECHRMPANARSVKAELDLASLNSSKAAPHTLPKAT